jgi:uncharacterized protein (TIGR00255 family)
MTGFGAGAAAGDHASVHVEARATNHRHLDVRVRAPSELAEHSSAVEQIARGLLLRGRIELTARVAAHSDSAPRLDIDRARDVYAQLAKLRDEIAPTEPLPLCLLSAVPELFAPTSPVDPAALGRAFREAATAACRALDDMRAREGASLAHDLDGRFATVDALVERLRASTAGVVDEYRRRLRERIERLLGDVDVELEPGRLEHEIAVFADRCDVAEELTRLASHTAQLRELATRPTPVGREIDFLLQEVNREVNTIGAKSVGADVAREIVALKAEIERIREQAQNVL